MFNELEQIDFNIACHDHITRLKKCEAWLEDSYAPQVMPENFKSIFTNIDTIKTDEKGNYTKDQLTKITQAQCELAARIQSDFNSVVKTLTRNRGLASVYGLISIELNNNKFEGQITIQDSDSPTHHMARILSTYIAGDGYTIRDIHQRRTSMKEPPTQSGSMGRKRNITDPNN